MWVKFWSNKQLWIWTSAIFRKIKIFQIPSSIRSIMSLTNDPFFISDDPLTSCSDHGKTLFFGPLANLLYLTYFSIFSYKKIITSSWNTYLSCGKTFVINYFNVWQKKPKKLLFLDVPTRSAPLRDHSFIHKGSFIHWAIVWDFSYDSYNRYSYDSFWAW